MAGHLRRFRGNVSLSKVSRIPDQRRSARQLFGSSAPRRRRGSEEGGGAGWAGRRVGWSKEWAVRLFGSVGLEQPLHGRFHDLSHGVPGKVFHDHHSLRDFVF